MDDDVEQCNSGQSQVPCSYGAFPNIGTTHCYTAVGRIAFLDAPEIIHTGIARGCINCTGYHCIFVVVVVVVFFFFFICRMEEKRRLFKDLFNSRCWTKTFFPVRKYSTFSPVWFENEPCTCLLFLQTSHSLT